MNKNVVILEKGANPILNNLAKEISDASDFVVKTGSDDVISEIEQEEEFSDGGKNQCCGFG
ncbi:hypothetical protein IID24_03460 [Patescibacteria group bacterium]|nr:hypothetical protein [Patescibacteria group bacterium]